jgi:ParB family chromosome partitioning protein
MTQEKKKALGKGLEALLPRKPAVIGGATAPASAVATMAQVGMAVVPAAASVPLSAEPLLREHLSEHTNVRPGEMVVEIPLELIARNPYQTRVTTADDPSLEELADSIKGQGVMQPVVVRPMKQRGAQGELYELIAGERRWMASQKAGKTHLPALVRDVPSEQVLVLTIIENLHRQDLNPMQHARALERLAEEFRLTQEEVASRTGLARSAVANYLRLVRLPEQLQAAVADGRLGFGQAKVLMSLGNTPERDLLARKVIAGKLTVRETEALLQEFLHPKAEDPAATVRKIDPNVRAAEVELQRALGCRVQIRDRKGKGKIVIEYKSLEDFDRVLEALK